jgi:hypothetical protein
MDFMKCVNSYKINGKCEKKYILSLLIDKNSLIDESYSLAEQDHLKSLLILLLENRSFFCSSVLKDIIIRIFEEEDIDIVLPFYLLDFLRLLIDRVKVYFYENKLLNVNVEVPLEYYHMVTAHYEITNRSDDIPTLTSLSPASPASDATITDIFDEQ